ncbi:MAG: RIP metalloprotease RseP [Prevotella sp.]|nr:RIP metalloprotease RseP [Prevotella sp.]MBQ6210645.1 RIP metalloprotease RseP [Prevotella sp.]
MEIFLIRLLQFMLAISLLVLLHEGGHFFFSKLFGVRVEKFYLFFDPWFHLFEFKPKKSETTYGIGWLPLGGYCKIAGMIDESLDTEQMKQPVQPWEFRAKPAWQRLLIMIGGVLVNFLLALFIYSMVLFYWGDSYIAVKDMKMGMKFNKEAKGYGFQDHDILIGTENGAFKDFSADLFREISKATRVDIIRDGKPMSIALPGDINLLGMLKATPNFVRPFVPAVIDTVMPSSPAEKIHLQKGDKILAVNDSVVDSWNEFTDVVGRLADQMTIARSANDSLQLRTATIVVNRKATDAVDTMSVVLSPDLTLGVGMSTIYSYYEPTKVSYGFFESFPAGIKYGWNVLAGYVGDLKYVFTSDGAKSLGGFGAIGSLFPPVWDWHMFWLMTAFLSIILAFMNILPIPALDGGHVLFLLYEMITGRKPSDKFMVVAEYVGISILLLLMVVANLNDILRWLGYM